MHWNGLLTPLPKQATSCKNSQVTHFFTPPSNKNSSNECWFRVSYGNHTPCEFPNAADTNEEQNLQKQNKTEAGVQNSLSQPLVAHSHSMWLLTCFDDLLVVDDRPMANPLHTTWGLLLVSTFLSRSLPLLAESSGHFHTCSTSLGHACYASQGLAFLAHYTYKYIVCTLC